MSPWRNRLARSAVNRKVPGSNPGGDVVFSSLSESPAMFNMNIIYLSDGTANVILVIKAMPNLFYQSLL